MALIPPDAGIRMRMQTEAGLLQPTERVAGVPSDLPEMLPGQVFQARIQDVMPENTYRALVAGKQITLQLPEGAKPGDTLELVVVDRTPRTIIARQTEQPANAAAANEPYPNATLSPTGKLIADLLLREGEAPRPRVLNRGEPLLSQPPARADDLVPVLRKAVAESGLFYESHQAQWAVGKLPLAQLLQEPQGQLSPPATLRQHGLPPSNTAMATAEPTEHQAPRPQAGPLAPAIGATSPSLLQALFGAEERIETNAPPLAPTTTATPAVPEHLQAIVQQQLDALATQRLIWHGEAWPGQKIEWEVVRDEEKGGAAVAEDSETSWRTTLRLDTPRLGPVEASLRLASTGIYLVLTTPAATSATDLRDAAPALGAALNGAGIPLRSFLVKNEPA